jgi:kinetochore protein Nuf2
MSQYSYPLLQSDEILTVLRELTIDATSDDLINPTPQKVHVVFSQLVELLLNQKQEDTAQPQFSGIDMLEYPELHEESVPAIGFISAWCASNFTQQARGLVVGGGGGGGQRGHAAGVVVGTCAVIVRAVGWPRLRTPPSLARPCRSQKLMNTVGVKDFSMIDLIKPESKRLRRHISAVINFAKFREERLVHGVELTQEVDALAAKKQQAEDENERLVNELRAATAVREQEAPEESRLKGENEGLATTVQEAFNQQTAVHEDSLRLKQELEQVKDQLAETKYKVLNAKEELEQLRAQIVPDPKKLKQELQALQEAVAHEKENVRQVEASGCEASRQLEASERAEREMEAVLHGQARTPQPPQHPPPVHSP